MKDNGILKDGTSPNHVVPFNNCVSVALESKYEEADTRLFWYT